MAGHGWVVKNADGSVARCGGPALCPQCAADLMARDEAQAVLPVMAEDIAQGRHLFAEGKQPTKGAECWEWLQQFQQVVYGVIQHQHPARVRLLMTYEPGPDAMESAS